MAAISKFSPNMKMLSDRESQREKLEVQHLFIKHNELSGITTSGVKKMVGKKVYVHFA